MFLVCLLLRPLLKNKFDFIKYMAIIKSNNGGSMKDIKKQITIKHLKNNKYFVLESVKKDGYVLKYASNELKADKEVVLEAVKQNGLALNYASEELQTLLKNSFDVVLDLQALINNEILEKEIKQATKTKRVSI